MMNCDFFVPTHGQADRPQRHTVGNVHTSPEPLSCHIHYLLITCEHFTKRDVGTRCLSARYMCKVPVAFETRGVFVYVPV